MFEDSTIKVFTKILNFVNELNSSFGSKYPNVKLYYKFLSKTPISNKNAMIKQNSIFKSFLQNNKNAIISKNSDLLLDKHISYNDKIFINISQLFSESDEDTRNTIFKHLQLISYMFFQEGDMKEALTNSLKTSQTSITSSTPSQEDDDDSNETNFIDTFIDKIDETFQNTTTTDPMEATMSLLQNGVFTDMIKTMQKDMSSGKLNINKLLGSVKSKLSSLPQDQTDGINNPFDLLNNMTNSQTGENPMMAMMSSFMGGDQSNVSNVMSMMSNMMSQFGSDLPSSGGTLSLESREKKE